MTKEIDDRKPDRAGKRQPYRVRLPGFVTDEEIGLGDTIKRAASYFGARPCGGCEQRRVALNRWMTFGKGARG
jgi:hypothetical protein